MPSELNQGIDEFRRDVREWIAANVPDGLVELADWRALVTAGSNRAIEVDRSHPAYVEWEQRLRRDRWICPQWPHEYGGRDLDEIRLIVLDEEFHRAGVPRVTRGAGEALVGPALLEHGTQDQKDRFLRRIVDGTDVYCQGFSEPGAGSDLAGIQTVGEIADGAITVTGQKVWTSAAADATMIFVLCRTGDRDQRHKNLSFVLMSMDDPGFDVRPIVQMTGADDFAEVFINGATAPVDHIIGAVDDGWRVAMSTLAHERTEGLTIQQNVFPRMHEELRDVARRNGSAQRHGTRHRIVDSWIRLQLVRMSNLRTVEALQAGQPLGSETSLSKLRWSEYYRDFGALAMDVLGPAGLPAVTEGRDWHDVFLSSHAPTIYSGTSEIQRHIIATKALGLPRR